MTHAALIAAALCFIAFAALRIHSRPGLMAAVALNSYIFQIYFGSIGPAVGAFVLLVSVAKLSSVSKRLITHEIWLLLWLLFSVSSVVASWHIDIAFYYAASFVLLAASNYLYARAFGENERFIPDLILGSCLAVLICEPGILMTPTTHFARLSGNLTPVGASLMADVPIIGCLSILLIKRDLNLKLAALTAVFLIFVMLPISLSLGTRGVFLGAGAGGMVLLALRIKQGRILKLLVGSAAVLVLVAIFVMVAVSFFPQFGGGVALRAIARLGANFATGGGIVADTSSLERLQFWREALHLFLESPLYGYSLGAFTYLANNAADMYPHNMFLEILVNTGLIGLALFLAGFLPLAFAGIRSALSRVDDWQPAFVIAALVDIFVRMQVSMTITQGKLLFILLGLIAAQTVRRHYAARLPVTP